MRCSARTMRSFCCGSTSTKRSVPRREVPQRLVLERRELLAGQHRPAGRARSASRQMRRHVAVVAGDDLDADAERGEVADRARGVRLGRVEEEQEAREGHAAPRRRGRSPPWRRPCGSRARARGIPRRPCASKAASSSARASASSGTATPSRSSVAQTSSTLANAPLVTIRCCAGDRSSAHDDRQALAQEVVGDLVDLA